MKTVNLCLQTISKRLVYVFICCSVGGLLLGCVSDQIRKDKSLIKVQTVLVLPPQSAYVALRSQLPQLQPLVADRFKRAGFKVMMPDAAHFAKAHEDALLAVGSVYQPKHQQFVPLDTLKYAASIAKALQQHYTFDAMVDSSLVMRSVTIHGGKASWDQVTASVPLKYPDKPVSTYPTPLYGLSLRLVAYAGDGQRIDSFFAGIVMPFWLDNQETVMHYQMHPSYQGDSVDIDPKAFKKATALAVRQWLTRVRPR